MMPWGRVLVAVLLTLIVFGGIGSVAYMLARGAPEMVSAPGLSQADRAALEQPYRQLAAGDEAALLASFVEEVDREAGAGQIAQLRTIIPAASPSQPRLVSWTRTARMGAPDALRGVHEYQYETHVVRVETELWRSEGAWRTANLYVNVATPDELAAMRFSLEDKPAIFLAAVAGALIVPVFIWGTMLAILFLPDVRRRWLWLIAAMIAIGTLRADSAGSWGLQLLSFQLFGSGATWSGSIFDPWVFSVAFPAGAVAFWLLRIFWHGRPREPAPEGAA